MPIDFPIPTQVGQTHTTGNKKWSWTGEQWAADNVASGGEANTASNVGTGEGSVFATKSGVDLQFKKIKAGSGVTITNGATDIQIDATGIGGGEANTASNVGATSDGLGLFAQKSGVDLQFKRIKAGSGISIIDGTNNVTIFGSSVPSQALIKAWVTFDGTTTTPTILSSLNVTSIGRNTTGLRPSATGSYVINFAPNTFTGNKYCVIGTGRSNYLSGYDRAVWVNMNFGTDYKTLNSAIVDTFHDTVAAATPPVPSQADCKEVNLIFFE